MTLLTKLTGYLHRVFDKAPDNFVAMVFSHAQLAGYSVADDVLVIRLTTGQSYTFSLTNHTLSSLQQAIGALPGFVILRATSDGGLLAGVLTEGEYTTGVMVGYRNLLTAYLYSIVGALRQARADIETTTAEMDFRAAQGDTLDYFGRHFRISRLVGETDAQYSARIAATVFLARGNNVVIATAIERVLKDALKVRIVDSEVSVNDDVLHNGVYRYNSTQNHNRNLHGLFDATAAIDLGGSQDINAFRQRVIEVSNAFRDAGTHLRQVIITGMLDDSVPEADDLFGTVNAVLTPMADQYGEPEYTHNAGMTYNSSQRYGPQDVTTRTFDELSLAALTNLTDEVNTALTEAVDELHDGVFLHGGQVTYGTAIVETDKLAVSMAVAALDDVVSPGNDDQMSTNLAIAQMSDQYGEPEYLFDGAITHSGLLSYGPQDVTTRTVDNLVLGSNLTLDDAYPTVPLDMSGTASYDAAFAHGAQVLANESLGMSLDLSLDDTVPGGNDDELVVQLYMQATYAGKYAHNSTVDHDIHALA